MADDQYAQPTTPVSWTPIIFGGLFLGAWIYGLLFAFPEWEDFSAPSWFFWGFIGLVIAGGLYAARMASPTVLIIILIVVGISIGMLILAAILEEEAHIFATVVAAAGAGLIAAGIPVPNRQWVPVEE